MLGKKFLNFFLAVCAAEEFLHLNLTLQLHQAIEHCLGTRWTSGHIYINRENFVNALEHAV